MFMSWEEFLSHSYLGYIALSSGVIECAQLESLMSQDVQVPLPVSLDHCLDLE